MEKEQRRVAAARTSSGIKIETEGRPRPAKKKVRAKKADCFTGRNDAEEKRLFG